MISWFITALVLIYAGYSLYKFIVRSKQGKCAVCELNKSCQDVTSCSSIDTKSDV